jgi:hypothetical protein
MELGQTICVVCGNTAGTPVSPFRHEWLQPYDERSFADQTGGSPGLVTTASDGPPLECDALPRVERLVRMVQIAKLFGRHGGLRPLTDRIAQPADSSPERP